MWTTARTLTSKTVEKNGADVSPPPTNCQLHNAAVLFAEKGTEPSIPFDNSPSCGIETCWICHDARRYSIAEKGAIGKRGPIRQDADAKKARLKAVVAAYQEYGLACISAKDTAAAKELGQPSLY